MELQTANFKKQEVDQYESLDKHGWWGQLIDREKDDIDQKLQVSREISFKYLQCETDHSS